jgi:hypothetical protein
MELSTTDKQKLHDALLDAFTSDSFARMLDLYAGKRMDFYTARFKDLPDIVVDVMNGAQREAGCSGSSMPRGEPIPATNDSPPWRPS